MNDDHIFCPLCGYKIETNIDLKKAASIECPKCGNSFHNPVKRKITPSFNFDSGFFEKHGSKIVIGLVAAFIVSIMFLKLRNSDDDRGGETLIKTQSEIRIDKLKAKVTAVFDENKRCQEAWIILAKLKAAEDKNYGDMDVNLNMYPTDSPESGMLIYTSKFFIPSPKSNAIPDPIHGLPISFFYQFTFNKEDSIANKYLVVNYDKDTAITYDFNFRPITTLINRSVLISKIEKWQKESLALAEQQKKQIKEFEQLQIAHENAKCQKEKKFITDMYKMLMKNINTLESNFQRLSNDDFAIYLRNWNINANEIKIKYSQSEFECFFGYDYNRMLGFYQSAGLDFINVFEGTGNRDYYQSKSRMKESYELLMSSYKGH